jgi:aminoglycoside phosphotransferase (APT) family kinase protein
MPPADAAPKLEDVAAALERWAGGDLEVPPAPVSGGFDTFIYRFRHRTEGALILRLYPSVARGPSAVREAATLGFLAEARYPAPECLAVSADPTEFGLPYVVMREVPGRTVFDQLRKRPRSVGALITSLAAAQAVLHGVPVDGWPHPAEGSEIDRRIAALGDAQPADPALRAALDWLREHADDVRGEEPSICHLDFHPINALVADDGRMTIIDWENASLGDPHSDVARTLVLFHAAAVAANSRVERVVLRAARPWLVRSYRDAYRRHIPIDDRRLRFWMALHAADSWWEWSSLVDGTFDRATRTDERTAAAASIAPAMARLFARLVPEAGAAAPGRPPSSARP